MEETRGRADVALGLAEVLVSRATLAASADNQPDVAAHRYAEACGLAEGVLAHDARGARAHLAHLGCVLGQAHLAYFQGRFADVIQKSDAATAEIHAIPPGTDPTAVALDEAAALNERGNAVYYQGDPPGALRAYQDAAAVLERARQRGPDVRVLDQLAFTTYNVASTLDGLGRTAEELAWTERGVAIADQIRTFEDTPRTWRTVATVHLQHALALVALRRFDEAIAEAKATVAIRQDIAARSPHDYLGVRGVAVDLRALGDIYRAAGRSKDACKSFGEGRDAWDRLARSHGILDGDKTSEVQSLEKDVQRCGDRSGSAGSRPG
jgi:tetratricopeptide (TPR) repeat protein